MSQDLIGLCSDSVARRRTCSCKESHQGAEKGRFRTLSSTDSTSQLDPNRRYRNEASMLGVLYPYAHIVPYAIGKQCSYIIYNTLWRGLAELLISLGRQCEGLVGGISEEVSPTSFLYPLVKHD